MIDLHCDTVYALWKSCSDETLVHNTLHVDVGKMREGGVLAQCFALFVPMLDHVPRTHAGKKPWRILQELYQRFLLEVENSNGSLRQAFSVADILENKANGVLSAILTTEEGGAIEGKLDRLTSLWDMGVRIFSLTWNYENELAFPNSADAAVMDSGLKPLGREAVDELNRLGILVDVSHLSDGGFWEVAKMSRKSGVPFVATHSNSRVLTAETRNLTDAMLRELADCGGVAGLNFCPAFLLPSGTTESGLRQAPFTDSPAPASMVSRIDDMVRHVFHIRNVAGSDVLAIGTDFDGIGGVLEIDSSAKLPLLRHALGRAGMPESELDKLWEANALRVLQAVDGAFRRS